MGEDYVVFIKPTHSGDSVSFLYFGRGGVAFDKRLDFADYFSLERAEELASKDSMLSFARFDEFEQIEVYVHKGK